MVPQCFFSDRDFSAKRIFSLRFTPETTSSMESKPVERAFFEPGHLAAARHSGWCGQSVFLARLFARRSYFFPLLCMGQYFKAVNLDKREVVCPWCLSGGAKLWEWAANPQGSIFTLLLRKSSAGGGGDYFGYPTQEIAIDNDNPDAVAEALRSLPCWEGQPIPSSMQTIVGRWAGDRVCMIGDYDDSKLWGQLTTFRNVSADIVEAWNSFIDIPEMKLRHRRDCTCH
jgi:hypothetical protein